MSAASLRILDARYSLSFFEERKRVDELDAELNAI